MDYFKSERGWYYDTGVVEEKKGGAGAYTGAAESKKNKVLLRQVY